MSSVTIDLSKFLQDSKNTLLNPGKYFSSLRLSGGIREPLIKSSLYGISSGLIYLLCFTFKIRVLGPGHIGEAIGLLAFFKIVFGTIIGLFIGAVIILAISSICKGIIDLEANIRVTSSVLVIIPLYTILSISWVINNYFGMITSLLVFIFFLWILFHGLVDALKCKPGYARIAGYILTGLMILFLLMNIKNSDNQDNLKKDVKKTKEIKK